MATAQKSNSGWLAAWPDLLAFAGVLALAWVLDWKTTDLVWSLWLSSLVVGYAMIVWSIFGPVVLLGRGVIADQTIRINGREVAAGALGGGALLAGGLFMLAFFTVHFGMFHFVHSIFLRAFFPLDGARPAMPGLGFYLEVFRRYWVFLPLAFLSERQAFRWSAEPAEVANTSVAADSIAARKQRNAKKPWAGGGGMMAPYKNVIRMHLLIFFFAFAHFAKLENFLVYAIVYAVYFFPWRLAKREA